MPRSSRGRPLCDALIVSLIVAAWALASASSAMAADPSPGPSSLPGPTPTCTPEVEPNDQPDVALIASSAICLMGTLPVKEDQDLVLWDVEPAEALITWRITMQGIPTTITSVHLFRIVSEPGVTPIDAREYLRVDSDATTDVPGVATGVSLKAGTYVLGISRGDPAEGPPAPPGEYRVTIERERSLPANGDLEPNDDPTAATPVGGPISLIGDAQGSVDLYRWAITPEEAGGPWQLDVRGVAGDTLGIRLMDAAGTVIATTDMPGDGEAHLYDLSLAAGDYLIEMATTSVDVPVPYVLTTQPSTDAAADPEPNDSPAQAVPMAIGTAERSGRLAGPRDIDYYAFAVPQTAAATQTDISLKVGSAVDRRLCLITPDRVEVQCRQGQGDITLSNLSLTTGDYRIEVSGDQDLDDHYRLALTDVGPIVSDREIEPNDTTLTASPWDPTVVMRGRSANNDEDLLRLTVTGEPQVWRLDATGTKIRSVQWLEPDREIRGTADISADGSSASLWDMYLIPGEHWISIETEGEDYTLAMTPLGPLAAGSEREPNNDSNNAEPIDLDEPRAGRLTGPADADVYRFSLEAAEHVVIRVDPPADAGVKVKLMAAGTELMRLREPAAGQPFVYDAALPIGDYELTLESDPGSVRPYELLVERADPYLLPADLEPNDVPAAARDLPSTLHVQGMGRGIAGEDDDWYRIATPPDPSLPLVVTTTAVTRLELTDGVNGVGIDPDASATTWTSRALPAGVPLFLHVTSSGDYVLDISGAGLVAQVALPHVPLELSISPNVSEVAAYELFGQRVDGMLTLANTGDESLTVTLDGTTSDTAWTVALAQDTVDVPAGASVDVPLSIAILPDAFADVATRITVRAAIDDGRLATASTVITPRRDALPVGAQQAWPVPTALLGGLDAASLALGATIVSPTFSEDSERLLHDGLALDGTGFVGYIANEPVHVTVDLATDDPVPVSGIIIDPLAVHEDLSASPRLFDLLLSDDAVSWDLVLSGELSPRREDQAFVLDGPVPARFAQLRIRSTWAGTASNLQLGEWQVVATPGWAPAAALNIATPALGGHVVWTVPGATDPSLAEGLLDEGPEPNHWKPYLEPGTEVSWVVGFRDGRAAQVTELQWVDPPGSDPLQRFDQVTVQVSTETPLGPWRDVGTWQLTRAGDGSVPAFPFSEPTWARFVRIAGAGPTETGYQELPTTLRVIERATDDTYRSIVGAWGRNEPNAIRELLEPPDLSAVATPVDLADGNDTAETATPLVADVTQDARIQRGKDIDWYELTIPAGLNTLDLVISASAAAGLVPTLHDGTGAVVEMVEGIATDPGTAHFFADVVPGATYRVLVEQPPFSTAFTYDTSGSLAAYLTYISTALRGFAEGVTPGEEAVWIMPFEDPPLLRDWSDDTYALQNAVAGVASISGSSAAEASLVAVLAELEGRTGTRAILVVTDAETSSYAMMGDLWSGLATVHPIVFAVHVAGGGAPQLTTNLMQDWAHSWGGHYEYATSHGQIDRAFDRLATWLRRPAAYTIGYTPSFVSHAPGGLSIMPPDGPDGPLPVIAGTGVGVEILLDTSGSMQRKVGKQRRIQIAKAVLSDLVDQTLPSGLPVALRIFDPKRKCGSTLLAPLAPLDKASMLAMVKDLKIAKGTKTPIAATLSEVAADLAGSVGPKIIVLVTDGQESCKGDPEQAIRDLVAQGLDVRVNIVGFAIDDAGLKAQLERWAGVGNGQAFDAQGAKDLAAGIASALRAPFRVYDKDGQLVASGVVGGDQVALAPGSYRVEVLTDPVIVLEDVVIPAGESRTIQLEAPVATP